MADRAIRDPVLFDIADVREFPETRPAGERWDPLEGLPMRSAAPRTGHRRIAGNFERHLNAALRTRRPQGRADREIGIEASSRSIYRPEPEVTVVDDDLDTRRNCTDRSGMVMEVPSAGGRGRTLASKIRFYRAHVHNRCIVIVDQDVVEVTIQERDADGRWQVRVLRSCDEAVAVAGVGPICTVAGLCAGAHLDPRRAQRA